MPEEPDVRPTSPVPWELGRREPPWLPTRHPLAPLDCFALARNDEPRSPLRSSCWLRASARAGQRWTVSHQSRARPNRFRLSSAQNPKYVKARPSSSAHSEPRLMLLILSLPGEAELVQTLLRRAPQSSVIFQTVVSKLSANGSPEGRSEVIGAWRAAGRGQRNGWCRKRTTWLSPGWLLANS